MKLITIICCFFLFIGANAQSSVPSIYEDGVLHVKIKDSCEMEFIVTDSLGNLDASQLVINGINFNYFALSKIEKTFKLLGKTNTRLYRIYTFYFPDNNQKQALIDSLLKIPCVEYAEEVPVISQFYTPTDLRPQSGTQNQWYLYTIKAKEAWDVHHGPGAKQIKIAVVDDAIWLGHPDITGVLYTNTAELLDGLDNDNNGYIDDVQGWDAANNDNDPNPPSVLPPGKDFTHGTHVAAIAGAQTDAGSPGMASIGFGVQLIPVKIALDATGTLSAAFEGVEYAVAAGADVINMSWGGPGYSSTYDQMVADIRTRGIVLVAAAGNDNVTTLMYPASYPAVISVGATDINDQKSGFSNYNASIDVMAPGTDIYSALYDPANTTIYGNLNGTSMASPMVAGLCGLMLSYNPNLTPDALENCLKASCDNIDALNSGYIGMMGSGRINAENAMVCLQTAPVVDFTSNFQTLCPGKIIKFACNFTSGNHSPTYSWSFPGGSPSTSTSANPAITYSTPGVYTVSVVVTNPFGSTTLTKTNYITVKSVNGNYNYSVYADNNWFMYTGLALKFPKSSSSNPQLVIEGSQSHGGHGEGGSSISNYDGQPLIYTNGYNIYNRHHKVMDNGGALVTNYSLSDITTLAQNSIIVPDPDECSSLYYVFHITRGGLYYSLVDMDGDNGLGTVIQKSVRVGNPYSSAEKITAIMHCNGRDVWVITRETFNGGFRAYLVTSAGVSHTPVISQVGYHPNTQGGQMKGSPGGDKIAMAVSGTGSNADRSYIFDFDKGTGVVSNPIKFNTSTLNSAQKSNYGIEFSADGTKVYLTGISLVQYDLNGFSASTLPTVIATSIAGGGIYSGTLELGPDGKIYASKTGSTTNGYTKLDVIDAPNQAGTACNLIPNGMPLTNPNGINYFQWGLNNSFISKTLNYHKEKNLVSYKAVICNGVSATLDAGPGSLYEWEGGQTTRKIVVTVAGDYPVIITDANGCKTKVVFVVSNETAVLELGPDQTFICGQPISIVLDAGIGFATYIWSTGETTSSIIATAPGLYWVEVTTPGGCKFRDEVLISTVGSQQQVPTRITYTCGSPGLDLYTLNINPCPAVPGGTTTNWLSSISGLPVSMPVVPTGNMNFRREFMDATGCIYCTEVIDITFEPAAKVIDVIQLACEGNEVGISPSYDPPCNTATLWEYFYPDGTSDTTSFPTSLVTPAINGDVFKIRAYMPNGCYCDYITNVVALGPAIKKKTVYINCGDSINLEDYAQDSCPNTTNYYWGEDLQSQLVSYTVSPRQTITYYRQSYGAFGCLDCIFELTVVVLSPTIINPTINIPCGSQVDLEAISGCNGLPGTFYWFDGSIMGPHPPNTGLFTVTQNTTFYRESLNGCPCPGKVTVNVINPATQTVDIPSTYCYGKVFEFQSLCPPGTGTTTYKLLDTYGEEMAISSSPNISKEIMRIGTYKMITIYENGCTCTTEYRNTRPLPPEYHHEFTTITFCNTITSINPPATCPGAAYYKWFSNDYYTSVLSLDGTLTLAQRILLVSGPDDPNKHDPNNLKRVAYDANGCIICVETFRITTYARPTLSFGTNVFVCDGECFTINLIDKFFPNLQRCKFSLVPPPNGNVASINTSPDGSITVCVKKAFSYPGYILKFQCSNPENGCDFVIYIRITQAFGCKKGSDEFTGLEETVGNDYRINIFPNPTTGIVTVDMKGSAGIVKNIQVFDVLGRRVVTATITEEQKEFNLSEFSKGIYTIRIETEEKVHTQKIVLK